MQSRGVLIEVTDDDPDVEELKSRAEDRSVPGYHGLLLVTHLSLEWGAQENSNRHSHPLRAT
ncbi:hypothetical protein B1H26_39580 [Amycolatopsis sp. BJA-103]|nr:hypothetical protein BKN51_19830 [Amycolatopsis sp. BJA-103]PNE13566.1 hypothetical protein B1H26_39580 [Amycolatopsis sp. BJA-103]